MKIKLTLCSIQTYTGLLDSCNTWHSQHQPKIAAVILAPNPVISKNVFKKSKPILLQYTPEKVVKYDDVHGICFHILYSIHIYHS